MSQFASLVRALLLATSHVRIRVMVASGNSTDVGRGT